MNKLKALITNINKILLVTILVLFATLTMVPATVSAVSCTDAPEDPTCTPDTPIVEPIPEAGPTGPPPPGGGTTSATKDDVCAGLELATGQGCEAPVDGESSVETVIATVINVLSWIVGVAAVIMLIISGFRFVVSSGDTQAVSNAKNGIIYAVIGLLIVLFAQVIVQFVVDLA